MRVAGITTLTLVNALDLVMATEEQTIEYPDASYSGSLQHGRFEGFGVYTYDDGTRYEGAFKNGQFHGQGKLVFNNGVYEGVWKHGKVRAHAPDEDAKPAGD